MTDSKLYDKIVEVLKTIYDPEIPVNIYELGLIYDIRIDSKNRVFIQMTLTAPGCPVAETLPLEVKNKINTLPEVKETEVQIVWDPPWTPDMMTEAAKLELGIL